VRLAIVGYGNLGKAAHELIKKNTNFELVKIFTRENIDTITDFREKIDVVLICVGSQTDAPLLTPQLSKDFCTVDSFDTHKEMTSYIEQIKKTRGKKCVNIVGVGWDPGLFSVIRIYLTTLFGAEVQTFWGPGVSLGHTNAIKQISGVKDALQFTVPVAKENRHKRVCHIVANQDDQERIEWEIKTMPHYFAGTETEVRFVPRIRKSLKHGGHVIAHDKMSQAQFRLKMKSNPHFTAQIMLAYATAAVRLRNEKKFGVFTVTDIPPKYLVDDAVGLV